MLSLLVLAFATATPANLVPAVAALEGCWKAPGQVRGKDATSIAQGEWHLDGRYFMLHLRSIGPKDPYEASLVYGAGDKPNAISGYWMDSFGGAYATPGVGTATGDGFSIIYTYPDSTYTNRFAREGSGWRWTIMEQAPGKPEKLFAEYRLTPASCHGMKFSF